MARSRDASGAVHRKADVAPVGDGRLAGVHADSNPHLPPVRPRMLRKCALAGYSGHNSVACTGKDEEEGVALSIDFPPAVPRECAPQQATMFGEHIAVLLAKLALEAGGALDVREQEGDGPARELVHA